MTAAALLALAVAVPVWAQQEDPEDSATTRVGRPLPTPFADPTEADGSPLRNPVRRIAAEFNFEEEDNPYPVPRHWVRAQDSERSPRPGFPRYNEAEFDFQVARSGTTSVKLPVHGGNTSLRLSSGVIPVFAEGDYAVNAWVRTASLNEARAFVTARILDQSSQPIPGAEVRSEPIHTRGEWTEVALQLIGAPAGAAYLQVELQVLQPRAFQPVAGELAHKVWPEDLSGAAWFDDIMVCQLPRVEITTGAGANIVLAPAKPTLRILVRDFVGEKLDGHLVVTDMDDQIVQDIEIPLATAGRPQEWLPHLPKFGWYRVALFVRGEKDDGTKYRVGGADLSFLWLDSSDRTGRASEGPRSDNKRFGIIADRIEPDIRPSLAAVGRTIGTGFVSIPLWESDSLRQAATSSAPDFGRVIDGLSQAGQQIVVCIPSVPKELLVEFQLDPNDPLALADVDPKLWMPYLQPVLDRYGQRLTRWQIGRAGMEGAFWRPDVIAAVNTFGSQLATLVPGPRVSLPWRAEYTLPSGVPGDSRAEPDDVYGVGTLLMSFPSHFDASATRDFVERLIARAAAAYPPVELVFIPELLSSDTFGEHAVVTEMSRRTIEFWAARTASGNAEQAVSMALSHPWRRVGEYRPQLVPDASLGAMRTLIDHLSERRIIGEYQLVPGVKCYILADQSGPAGQTGVRGGLVAWNESAAPEDAVLRRYLGEGRIETIDMFGNRADVHRTQEAGQPHLVPISETPVFIEGADPMLAMFCSQVRVEPAFLPAVQTEHDLNLVLTNPWPHAISGKLQITPPDHGKGGDVRRRWSVTPDGIVPFSLGAGQTKNIPWTVVFPYFEETGEKKFSVVVRLTTDQELPPIVLPLSLQVGLQDLAIEPDVQLGPKLDGPDVIIIANVSNRGDRSRMLKIEAVAPDMPTQQTLIADLPPGEMVMKRIVLKNAAARLSGRRVHISLSDAEDQERLNTSVRVP